MVALAALVVVPHDACMLSIMPTPIVLASATTPPSVLLDRREEVGGFPECGLFAIHRVASEADPTRRMAGQGLVRAR